MTEAHQIMVLGDSITGMGPSSYASYLEDELLKAHSDLRVINLAKPALDTSNLLESYDQLLKETDPQVLLLMLGKSDPQDTSRNNLSFESHFKGLKSLNFLKLQLSLFSRLKSWSRAALFYFGSNEEFTTEILRMAHLRNSIHCNHLLDFSKFKPLGWSGELRRLISGGCKLNSGHEKKALSGATADLKVFEELKGEARRFATDINIRILEANFKEEEAFLFSDQVIKISPDSFRAWARVAWWYFRHDRHNQSKAIEPFEIILRKDPHYESAIRALCELYLKFERFKEGAEFFEDLREKSQLKDLITAQLAALYHLGGDERRALETIQVMKHKYSNSRHAQKGLLSFHQALRQEEDLKSSFDHFGSLVRHYPPLTVQNYQHIVDKALQKGIRVFALQYPVDTTEALVEMLGSYNHQVHVIDTRQIILNAKGNLEISDLFKEDFEHLTDKGAELLGRNLAPIVLKEFQ